MNNNLSDFFQENFVRQGIKEFPHKESQLFKTLVANFVHCQNYGEGLTGAEYLNQVRGYLILVTARYL